MKLIWLAEKIPKHWTTYLFKYPFYITIQFDYCSTIISAFFRPCLGFPLKQTPGLPWHIPLAWTQIFPKGAWTGLVWNGVCWSLSCEWNAMCSTSATSKLPDSYPRGCFLRMCSVSGFVEGKAEFINILFIFGIQFVVGYNRNIWLQSCAIHFKIFKFHTGSVLNFD